MTLNFSGVLSPSTRLVDSVAKLGPIYIYEIIIPSFSDILGVGNSIPVDRKFTNMCGFVFFPEKGVDKLLCSL